MTWSHADSRYRQLSFPHIHQPMKMVWHQAIAQKIAIRQDIFPHFSDEKQIVFRVKENGLAIIPLIVNVINGVLVKFHKLGFE